MTLLLREVTTEYEKVQNKARVTELLTIHATSASGILAISRWILVLKCGKFSN